jgi:hypothetical protein
MKSHLLFITLCLLVVSSSMGSDCDSNGISRRTVELGMYPTKEKCGRHCGNSCNTECGEQIYSWNCHRENSSAKYKCICTCARHCYEI